VIGPFPEGVSDRGWDAMAEDPDGRYGIDQLPPFMRQLDDGISAT
jgi:hypothetical protein